MLNHYNPVTISNLKNGAHFYYHGVEWIKLGNEQEGALAITDHTLFKTRFDMWHHCNKFNEAEIFEELNEWIRKHADLNDLRVYTINMMDDRGCKSYGKASCFCGLLTAELKRKYFEEIPNFHCCWWLATPWRANGNEVIVVADGNMDEFDRCYVGNICQAIPTCIFELTTEVKQC